MHSCVLSLKGGTVSRLIGGATITGNTARSRPRRATGKISCFPPSLVCIRTVSRSRGTHQAEFQASQTLVNAAKILSSIPAAMQLRYLQTLTEIGAEQNSTIIFPMPIDIIKPFLDLVDMAGKPAGANGGAHIPLVTDMSLNAAAPAA